MKGFWIFLVILSQKCLLQTRPRKLTTRWKCPVRCFASEHTHTHTRTHINLEKCLKDIWAQTCGFGSRIHNGALLLPSETGVSSAVLHSRSTEIPAVLRAFAPRTDETAVETSTESEPSAAANDATAVTTEENSVTTGETTAETARGGSEPPSPTTGEGFSPSNNYPNRK